MKNYWNYRLLAHEQVYPESSGLEKEIYLQVHEVHYKNGNATAYSQEPVTVGSETKKVLGGCSGK